VLRGVRQDGASVKIYLATRYYRHPEMRGYRTALATLGHEVTSHWIDIGGDGLTAATLGPDPGTGAPHAALDLADVRRADVVMVFTGEPSTTGGMHVELGYALGLDKRVILVGPVENIFHTLPQIERYADWDALMAEWLAAA
jgi:nucleoside 2-deoxyribosyltransferase